MRKPTSGTSIRIKKIDIILKKKLVSISFSNDTAYPGLQAADLIDGLMRLESLRVFGYHTHDFRSLVGHLLRPKPDQKMKWVGFTGDPEKMAEIGESFQKLSIR